MGLLTLRKVFKLPSGKYLITIIIAGIIQAMTSYPIGRKFHLLSLTIPYICATFGCLFSIRIFNSCK